MSIDPSDDLDWIDQDTDMYYVRDLYEGTGAIMWGLAAAAFALLVYGLVGLFA